MAASYSAAVMGAAGNSCRDCALLSLFGRTLFVAEEVKTPAELYDAAALMVLL